MRRRRAGPIAEIVGGEAIERGFLGAICRWTGIGATGPARVTFKWFEKGTLAVESGRPNSSATRRGRHRRRPARSARADPADPGSCGITAGSRPVCVVGWWVQYPGGDGADPCECESMLVESTLDLAA
ncbi:DUF3558 domain-containing protein [Rhodococcus hoagii]|nr:DUF3558 domain-containing protein [Prescottella equi]